VEIYLDSFFGDLDLDDTTISVAASPPSTASLGLNSPGFEQGISTWGRTNGPTNRSVIDNPAVAHEGSYYLDANVAYPGPSISQDVAAATIAGTSYTATVWMRAAIPNSTFNGDLALWGLGGTQEIAMTPFSVGSTWTPVQVTLSTSYVHTDVRLEIYMNTVANDLYMDEASILPNLLSNPSFEQNGNSWDQGVGTSNFVVETASVGAQGAADGIYFAGANRGDTAASRATTVNRVTHVGETYTASLWVRSAVAGVPFSGTLMLWGLGGVTESAGDAFTTGDSWSQISVQLPIAQTGHTQLKFELYLTSPNVTVQFDGAQLN
jgi:hypothetical protein